MSSMSFLISSNLASASMAERRADQILDRVVEGIGIVASHTMFAAAVLFSIILIFRLYGSIAKRIHLKRAEALQKSIQRQKYQQAVARAAREAQFAGGPAFGRFVG